MINNGEAYITTNSNGHPSFHIPTGNEAFLLKSQSKTPSEFKPGRNHHVQMAGIINKSTRLDRNHQRSSRRSRRIKEEIEMKEKIKDENKGPGSEDGGDDDEAPPEPTDELD